RRHTRFSRDWSSDVCSSDLLGMIAGAALAANGVAAQEAPERYDVLIRGGRLLDGTGAPWRYADVALRGDRIVEVGAIDPDATARSEERRVGKDVRSQGCSDE